VTALFLVLLAVHVAQSMYGAWRYPAGPGHLPPSTPMVFLTQTPMFLLAIAIGIQRDVFTRALIDPFYLAVGMAAGHAIFSLSVWIIHKSHHAGAEMFLELRNVWRFAFESPYVLSRFITVAVTEEIIYRGISQPLLMEATGSAVAGIVLTAVIFSIVHHHFFRNTMLVSCEFLAFSLLLGLTYYYTGSLLFVIVIHAVRDIEIAYLEFDQRLEECGDREEAIEAIENVYAPLRPSSVFGSGAVSGEPSAHAARNPQSTTPAPMEES